MQKKIKISKSNLVFFIIFAIMIMFQMPNTMNNFEKEGMELGISEVEVLNADYLQKKVNFPLPNNSIVIFWATWCTPCKIEMMRLKNSVKKGNIKQEQIFAINPFESKQVIREFLHKESYPFLFIEDNGIASKLNITRTPTTLFFNGNKIESLSSGMSVIGILRAEAFLNE